MFSFESISIVIRCSGIKHLQWVCWHQQQHVLHAYYLKKIITSFYVCLERSGNFPCLDRARKQLCGEILLFPVNERKSVTWRVLLNLCTRETGVILLLKDCSKAGVMAVQYLEPDSNQFTMNWWNITYTGTLRKGVLKVFFFFVDCFDVFSYCGVWTF